MTEEFKQPTLDAHAAGATQPATTPQPVVTPNVGLRTDGPTLEEFVAAGYDAKNYPPPGYASREPEALDWSKAMTAKQPVSVSNAGKTDELSLAVAAAKSRPAAPVTPEVKLPGKYRLEFIYKGKARSETFGTVRLAVARVAALERIGIIAATSTIDQPAAA